MGYDVIGDVHGQADKLHALLKKMGYGREAGVYRHPGRQAIFVGDLVDRGPAQLDTVSTVRAMCDAGSALMVMGNHEFNAIAWHTEDPDQAGAFLRSRAGDKGQRNRAQHAAFLAEVEHDTALYRDVIAWFMTLPLWLDLPGIRVVHACWHADYMRELQPRLTPGHQLPPALHVEASRAGSFAFRAVEAIAKGVEAELPPELVYVDKDGHTRRNTRLAWWKTGSDSLRDLALVSPRERPHLPDLPVTGALRPVYDNAKPVFFGHYWMTGQPALLTPMAACVDYSAGKGGPLVAYRWNGETRLDDRNFVAAD